MSIDSNEHGIEGISLNYKEAEAFHNKLGEYMTTPKKSAGKVWCEHVVWHKRHIEQWWLFSVGSEKVVEWDWKFCPICGTPRPNEKVTQ